MSFAGQLCAKLGDRDKARREAAQARGRDGIGQRLPEIGHDQHAVRKHVGKSGLFRKIEIDMDRIVVAGGAAIKRQPVARDRRKLLVDDALANSWGHDGLGLRMTTVRDRAATWTPFWLVTLVPITTSVIAPPFFSDTPVTRGRKVRLSPTTTGARKSKRCSPCSTRARSMLSAVRNSNGTVASIISR